MVFQHKNRFIPDRPGENEKGLYEYIDLCMYGFRLPISPGDGDFICLEKKTYCVHLHRYDVFRLCFLLFFGISHCCAAPCECLKENRNELLSILEKGKLCTEINARARMTEEKPNRKVREKEGLFRVRGK